MLLVALASWNQKAVWPAMIYLAGIMLVVGVSIAVIAAIRRRSRAGEFEDASNGFTLGQARHMKAKGLLTEQEFDQIKHMIAGSTLISDENRAATGDANRAATVRERSARLVDS